MSIIIEMHYYFWIIVAGFVATSAGIPAKLNQVNEVIILFCEQGSGIRLFQHWLRHLRSAKNLCRLMFGKKL